jgi:hypothetical protein
MRSKCGGRDAAVKAPPRRRCSPGEPPRRSASRRRSRQAAVVGPQTGISEKPVKVTRSTSISALFADGMAKPLLRDSHGSRGAMVGLRLL